VCRGGYPHRNAEALETFEKVNTLVVDKTGTLTEGKRVSRGDSCRGFNESQFCRWSLVSKGQANIRLRQRSWPLRRKGDRVAGGERFQVHYRKGVTGQLQSKRVSIGNAALMRTSALLLTCERRIQRTAKRGQTVC